MESILEEISAVEYQENDADALAVGQLAEDARDAIIEYQVSPTPFVAVWIHCRISVKFALQTAIYEQNCKVIVSLQLRWLSR